MALFVGSIQARNDTIVRGWVPEPDGRGTWSIIWSSLVTIFICTWSVLHLRVRELSKWHSFWRKCEWMFWTALIPEVSMIKSMIDFIQARSDLKSLVQWGGPEWTMTHAHFALARGFRIPYSIEESTECSAEQIIDYVKQGEILRPPLSEDELQSRSKSDWLVKLIAILQALWFALQTLFRGIQHGRVTPLEIMVVAFICCSIVTYGFWWSNPQNVEYPILIQRETRTSSSAEAKSPITPAVSQSTASRTLRGTERISQATPMLDSLSEPAMLRPSTESDVLQNADMSQNGQLWRWLIRKKGSLGLFVIGVVLMTVFGAIHCLAWTSPFPSRAEQLTWRICAVITTCLPSLLFLQHDHFKHYIKATGLDMIVFSSIVFYGVARVILIVLAFTAVRAQPADVYQTVNWTLYLPNFAA